LPAGNSVQWFDLISVQSQVETWRIVEVFSDKGFPFALELSWTAAGSTGAHALLTVSHAARVSVFANGLTARARSLAPDAHAVSLTVADGFAQTANVWEESASSDGSNPVELDIPPFATRFHLHLAETDALDGTTITLLDGNSVARARFGANALPPAGIPVGGASRLSIVTTQPTELRTVFELQL
jgi:hypothetical protein